jgi:DNA-binding MltR family transcriptional regulator
MKRVITKLDEVIDFGITLNSETDRGVALICAAFLEDDLEALLKQHLVDAPKVVGRLFDQAGPLGTFSSKIDLAFVAGLIPANIHRGLDLVRKIRNSFAHRHKVRSFGDQDIAARCIELAKATPITDDTEPRSMFINCNIKMIGVIHAMTELATHSRIKENVTAEDALEVREQIQSALKSVLGKLSPEEIKRLQSGDPGGEEFRKIFLEAMKLAGYPFREYEVDD